MTFKHKLSCRLALMRDIALAGTVTLAACELPTRPPETVPPGTASQVVVTPLASVLSPSQTTDLVAVALTDAGDTAATTMIWSATGGAVIDTSTTGGQHKGRYQAPSSPGHYKIIARAQNGGAADTAGVTVNPVPVATVAVTPVAAGITVGATRQFTAVALDSAGSPLAGRVITWSSIDPAVATVSATGLAAGVSPGSATIVATSEGKTGSGTLTVSLAPVASVTVSPASATIVNGATTQLSAVMKDAAGNTLSGRVVTWSTSDAAIATVNGNGLVTATGLGSATITATSEGKNDTAAITVTAVPVASVTVTPATASIVVGATQQLSAVTKDAAGGTLTGRVVTWATNNAAVATVNGSGLVTAIGAGSATITATSEGKSGTAAVSVTVVPVATVAVAPATSNLQVAGTVQLAATTKDAAGNVLSGRVVTWSTSNAGVATVSASGLVRAVAVGVATITATSEGKTGTAAITVTAVPVASVTVSPASTSLAIGATQQLAAVTKDAAGGTLTGRVVTWASNNNAAATVNGSGLVTAVAAGSATITATSEGINGTASITVTTPPPPPPPSGLPVFPGAEGYGTTTPGGRGGRVIHVTNLNDAGVGSLRDALTATGARTVVFDVSGYIRLNSEIMIGDYQVTAQDFLTVAGQTAPSPGITVIGSLIVRANDVLIQHIRVRPGISGFSVRRDALAIEGPCSRIVIDHVSVSWAGNGGKNFSTAGTVNDVTISNSITSEAFPYGLLLSENDRRVSIVRTLFAHNFDRNPEAKGGAWVALINNMVYNPGGGGRPLMGIWANPTAEAPQEGPNLVNLLGNTAKLGPTGSGLNWEFDYSLTAGSQAYSFDNSFTVTFESGTGAVAVSSPPFALPAGLTILGSGQVEGYITANAGARPADRDGVDTRIIGDVINRTGNSMLSNETQVGGYPSLAQNTRVLTIPANYATIRPSGYSVLEEDILFPLARTVEGR